METLDLIPTINKTELEHSIQRITGVKPNISLCLDTRIAMTIDKDLTPAEREQIQSLALLLRLKEAEEPVAPLVFIPENPIMGVEHRLSHVEDFLGQRYPP